MIIRQVSVFLENKAGTLAPLINLLADHEIDMTALSIAESPDYGILRIIVDDPDKAVQVIEEGGWPCKINHVLAIYIPDEPGSLAKVLGTLSENGINLVYSYAFLARQSNKAGIVLRVDSNDAAEKLLKDKGFLTE